MTPDVRVAAQRDEQETGERREDQRRNAGDECSRRGVPAHAAA